MAKVRVNYDGWLALPAVVGQRLGLATGDQLVLELAGETITLRPRRPGSIVDRQAAELPGTTAQPAAPPIVKRGPGRTGKSALPTVPPTLKGRGKRKAAAATV